MEIGQRLEYGNGLMADVVCAPHATGIYIIAQACAGAIQYAAVQGEESEWSFCFEEADDTPSHWRDSFNDAMQDVEVYIEMCDL